MRFRKAKPHEAEAIAHLHAESWQTAYKGILTDAFLDNDVFNNRLKVWTERFQKREKNRFICVVVEKKVLKGFVCVYGNDDAKWGALIDNLHVLPHFKGQGIGKRLMQEAAKWVFEKYKKNDFHLWVYEENHASRGFYERMGGENVETELHENPDGTFSNALRYAWQNGLLKEQNRTNN